MYVSTVDPRESMSIPPKVNLDAVERSKARSKKNYEQANEIHGRIISAGYRFDVYPINSDSC